MTFAAWQFLFLFFYHSGSCWRLSQKDSTFSVLSDFFLKVSQMNAFIFLYPTFLP